MAADTPHPASPPDPPQDRPGPLLGYGRHLLGTVRRHATAPTFTIIAACFGTASLSTILAHLNRGILRATALERMLLARDATGRYINIVTRLVRTAEPLPAPSDPQPEQPTEPKAARRPSTRGCDDPELFMPKLEDLELPVCRHALGRTFVEICIDLAVVPGFCTS